MIGPKLYQLIYNHFPEQSKQTPVAIITNTKYLVC